MYKRIAALYIMIIVCFMGLLTRIVYINNSAEYKVLENQSTKTLTVASKRGTIYDRNLERLTDSKNFYLAAVTPVMAAAEYLDNFLTKEALSEKIEKGHPFLYAVDEEINNSLIRTFNVSERYTEKQLAVHLIGYLDSTGKKGVTGIEKAYNEYLNKNSGSLKVSFEVNAVGRVLAGMKKTVTDDNYYSKSGIMLTVDSDIQKIAETSLENSRIESGAAVVMEAHSGEIVALASVPVFDPGNISLALTMENSPLVNKAFGAYSVGSVFKPLVAAAALEEGISEEFTYDCKGYITVGDTSFKCYEQTSHGEINMTEALECSCNTYFINLIMNIDSHKLLELCKKAGFGQSFTFAPGLESAEGILPSVSDFLNKGNLANFAFGQGDLTATPIQLLSAYHLLSLGYTCEPSVVKGFVDVNGLITQEEGKEKEKFLSDKTVSKLRLMLRSVVENGNAYNAASELLELSGKTGTAQSGSYEKGKEIYRTWFAGYFPSEEPEYIAVILNEKGVGGNADCAPVFREICEKIYLLDK